MRALLAAGIAPDLKNLTQEVREVANSLTPLYDNWLEFEIAGAADLLKVSQHGPFDLVWLSGHSSAEGFVFGTDVVRPSSMAQFLSAVEAKQLVLNSCFSAEHVMAIQRSLPDVEVVATIDPAGVLDNQAWVTGVYLARALVREGGSLGLACYAASAAGAVQYRYFPAGNSRSTHPSGPVHFDPNQDALRRIQFALEGDPLSLNPGMVRTLQQLEASFREFTTKTEKRLIDLEQRQSYRPTQGIPHNWFIVMTGLYILVVGLIIAWALVGPHIGG
jgi:hypothetical protein